MSPYIQRHNTLWLIRLSIRSMLQFYHKKNRKANINYIFFIKVYLSIPLQIRLNRRGTENPAFFRNLPQDAAQSLHAYNHRKPGIYKSQKVYLRIPLKKYHEKLHLNNLKKHYLSKDKKERHEYI